MADRYIIDFEKEVGFCDQEASFDQGLEKELYTTMYENSLVFGISGLPWTQTRRRTSLSQRYTARWIKVRK